MRYLRFWRKNPIKTTLTYHKTISRLRNPPSDKLASYTNSPSYCETMRLIGLLCLLVCTLTNGRADDTLDAESEAIFNQLESTLNDKQTNKENQEEIKKLIQDIKDEITTKKPEYAKNVLAMTKSLAGAVPKLKSTNELTVAEGALLVIAGVAEHFPPPVGIVVASLATLVSSVLGYLTPQKVNTIRH